MSHPWADHLDRHAGEVRPQSAASIRLIELDALDDEVRAERHLDWGVLVVTEAQDDFGVAGRMTVERVEAIEDLADHRLIDHQEFHAADLDRLVVRLVAVFQHDLYEPPRRLVRALAAARPKVKRAADVETDVVEIHSLQDDPPQRALRRPDAAEASRSQLARRHLAPRRSNIE